MKRICLALALICATALFTQAQDEAAQKAWAEYGTPGSMQKMMAMSDGAWTADMTFWMAPGAPPSKQAGVCVNKMILGGRYQESRYNVDMGGMPFEGIGILGYDNIKKAFFSTWIDNMSTGVMYLDGKWEDASRTLFLSGKTTDAATGKDMGIRETIKWIDDNNQTMEMFIMKDGSEFKSMEIKLTRKR